MTVAMILVPFGNDNGSDAFHELVEKIKDNVNV